MNYYPRVKVRAEVRRVFRQFPVPFSSGPSGGRLRRCPPRQKKDSNGANGRTAPSSARPHSEPDWIKAHRGLGHRFPEPIAVPLGRCLGDQEKSTSRHFSQTRTALPRKPLVVLLHQRWPMIAPEKVISGRALGTLTNDSLGAGCFGMARSAGAGLPVSDSCFGFCGLCPRRADGRSAGLWMAQRKQERRRHESLDVPP